MHKNITDGERLTSVLLGFLLLPKSRGGALSLLLRGGLGAELIRRGLSGHSFLYQRIGRDRRHLVKPDGPKSLLINKSATDLLDYAQQRFLADNQGRFRLTIDAQDWDFSIRAHPSDARGILEIRRANYQKHNVIARAAEHFKLINPEQSAQLILRKLKAFIECGEVPTIEGQSHGARSAIGKKLSQDSEVDEKLILNRRNIRHIERREIA